MREEDWQRVKGLSLFMTMAPGSFAQLVPTCFLQRFPAGVALINEGESADFLHVVIDGSVELYASGNGRETTMAVLEPVTAFILAAVIKDMNYLMSARTLEPSRILMIPAELIHKTMAKDPAFAQAMILELARGYRIMVKALKNQKLRTSLERLANHLLVLNEREGLDGRITLRTEKRLLASLLGITPENLSRAFKTLKGYGVDVKHETITLKDESALQKLAKPSPLIDTPED